MERNDATVTDRPAETDEGISAGKAGSTNVLFVDLTMDIGGAERVQQSLINGFDRQRIVPAVALFWQKGAVARELADAGVRVYEGLGSGKLNLAITRSLARIMRDESVGVVNCCNYPLTMVHARLAMKLAGVRPLVVALHSIGYVRRGKWRNLALKAMRPFVTKFVAVSQGQKRHYIETCGLRPDSIEVIYVGIDIERFSPGLYDRSARAELGIPEDCYTVGILAGLRPEKRHTLFLRVAELICRERKDVYFLLVGEGPERPAIESLTKELGLQERVKLAGARADVPRMLKAMDISVLCSAPMVETFPQSLIESMAMELPVVSTDVGSIDEIVVDGETGFLTPEGDADALSSKILELIGNRSLAREMGLAGRRRVEDLFTKELMIKHYEDLFRRLDAKAGGKS